MTTRGQMLLSLSRKEVSPHCIYVGVTDFRWKPREEFVEAHQKLRGASSSTGPS